MENSTCDENLKKCMLIFSNVFQFMKKQMVNHLRRTAYKKAIDAMKNMDDNDLTPEKLIQG